MFELGDVSHKEHREILNKLALISMGEIIMVGEEFYQHKEYFQNFRFFKSTEDLMKWIAKHPSNNSSILVKGSRGMQLEQLLDHL